LPVHDTVLATSSGYFRARLLRWDGSMATSQNKLRSASVPASQQQRHQQHSGGSGAAGMGVVRRGSPRPPHTDNTPYESGHNDGSGGVGDAAGGGLLGSGPALPQRELREVVTRHELAAAKEVVEFMYTNQINSMDIEHLLMVRRTSDGVGEGRIPGTARCVCVCACVSVLAWDLRAALGSHAA
jgi:hypothetical protein